MAKLTDEQTELALNAIEKVIDGSSGHPFPDYLNTLRDLLSEAEPEPKRFYSWIVEFEVAEDWVADGFDLDDERAADMLDKALGGWCYPGERRARVLKAPPRADIRREQGYRDDEPAKVAS